MRIYLHNAAAITQEETKTMAIKRDTRKKYQLIHDGQRFKSDHLDIMQIKARLIFERTGDVVAITLQEKKKTK